MEAYIREEFDEIRQIMKETETERKKSEMDFNRRMKKLGKLVGDYGNNQGDIAEDFFYRTLQRVKRLGTIEFDEVQRNVQMRFRKQEGEYDVVLYNGDSVGLVEIKSKLHPKDVEKFLTVDLPKFKELFPQMKDYRIYGAVAGMSVPSEVQELAEQEGLFVLTQAHDQLICANASDFQAREF